MKKNLFFLVLFSIQTIFTQMRIHEFLTNEFDKKAPAEYNAYTLLKESPLVSDVNYLVVPWITLIDKIRLRRAPRHLRLAGGFTVCQSIYFRKILPILKEIGIDTCFTPHATKEEYIQGIRIMPFPHCLIQTVSPAEKKDIWYSFIGSARNHIVRQRLIEIDHPENTVVKDSGNWFLAQKPKQKEIRKKEYIDVLSRSRFSLCPRGTGPGTFRFWESLVAGAIPVIIADDLRLPDTFDWSSCCIFVAEYSVDTIADVLSSITKEEEDCMRQMCYKAAKQFSGKNFVSVIRNLYDEVS